MGPAARAEEAAAEGVEMGAGAEAQDPEGMRVRVVKKTMGRWSTSIPQSGAGLVQSHSANRPAFWSSHLSSSSLR